MISKSIKSRKAQFALEFLMTYGWMIMVMLIVIGALAHFGVLSQDKFLPNKCILESGLACLDYRVETNRIMVVLRNGIGEDLTIKNVNIEGCSCSPSGTLNNNQKKMFVVSDCNNLLGKKFKNGISVEYFGYTGLVHTKKGTLIGKIEDSSGTSECGQNGNGDEENGGDNNNDGDGAGNDNGDDESDDNDNEDDNGNSNEDSDGPLDEISSQFTANTNKSLPDDWYGAKGNKDEIVIKLINEVPYDIYLESFTINWNDSENNFKHLQHTTEATRWNKVKIYGEVTESSPAGGLFDDKNDTESNLKIPASQYTIIDGLNFHHFIKLPTAFNLILNFNDSTSSTLSFTIS